ncbi:type II toxin-antitoxin system death-on-curing family toxin [Rhizobium sp. FKY42]|uniref:type II toxin-antitoxin system death-on-curing family toxin n=1 Tax=Rhizobium sp. FKY42 TaxID=2562310 RepID=UPI0010C01337|nr:type II toxin-antitoxin system death-on-curing family toxin [Rhizobium sp. FKY42]
MAEPRWLTADQVIALNAAILISTQETHFVRDLAALESAVARPLNRFHYLSDEALSSLTADLIYGIGKAHAFEQGNKRTAWAAGRIFARLNGYNIVVPKEIQEPVAKKIEQILTAEADGSRLISWIEPLLVRSS